MIVFVLTSFAANACMVGKDWEQKTAAKADKNKDGKIDYAEYRAMHSWSAAEENIAQNNWKAAVGNKEFMTVAEFLSGARPKCMRAE